MECIQAKKENRIILEINVGLNHNCGISIAEYENTDI